MKRSWWSVALVAGCLLCLGLLSGCGGGAGSTPENTVKNFYKATKNQDLDAMLKCMAPEPREMIEKIMEIQGRENFGKQMFAKELEKFEVKDAKITGDHADVKVAVTSEGKTEEKTEYLSRIDGRWYMDVPEEERQQMKKGLEMMKDPKMKEMMKDPKMMEMMKKMQEGLKEGTREGVPTPPE